MRDSRVDYSNGQEDTVLHRFKQGLFAAVDQELGTVQIGTRYHREKRVKVKQKKKIPRH